MMAYVGKWKSDFDPNLKTTVTCNSKDERTQRIKDNEKQGFELISTHEYKEGGKHFERTKYIAIMKRK